MVTHSKVSGFVIISEVRFVKSINPRHIQVLRDSVPLKEDVVVEAGVFDMRFLWEIKQTGHRGDRHDSTISVHVRWVSVEIAYEQHIIFSPIRFLDIPINVRQCPNFRFSCRHLLTPDHMHSDDREIKTASLKRCPVRIANKVVFTVHCIGIQFSRSNNTDNTWLIEKSISFFDTAPTAGLNW